VVADTVRWLAAVQLLLIAPFVLFFGVAGVSAAAELTPVVLAAAGPLGLFMGVACSPHRPYIRRDYWLVALYGPALLTVAALWKGVSPAIFALGVGAYELAILAGAAAFVGLGRAWNPIRRPWRIAIGVVVALALCLWVPYVAHAWTADACLDHGSAMAEYWSCRQ
jgi:hypothetical protein